MINIADLTSKVNELLNDNTLTTKFKTLYWIENLDQTFEKDGEEELNERFITAVVMNTTGQYRPIPDILISDQSFILQIYFPQSRQSEILANIEQFSAKLIGKTITVDGKTTVFNLDIPNLSEVKQENIGVLNSYDPRLSLRETELYGVLQIRIYFVESTGLMYGNQVSYKLKRVADANYTTLNRIDAATSISKSLSTEQLLNTDTSISLAQFNAFNNTVTFYYIPTSTLMQEIISDAETGANQNRQYNLQIAYGSLTFTKTVIIESSNISVPLGNVLTITCTFKKAA